MAFQNISIPSIRPGVSFFPSPAETCDWLGLPSSPRQIIKMMAEVTNSRNTLPSDKTLDNLKTKKGVRWSTMRPFIWTVIRELYGKIGLSFVRQFPLPKQDIHKLDIGFFWKPIAPSIQHGLSSSGNTLDISLFTKFIEHRTTDYQEQFEFFKRHYNNPSILNENPSVFIEKDIVHTLLTSTEQAHLLNALQTNRFDEESIELLSLYKNDFWLSLMAVVDNIITKHAIQEYEDNGVDYPFAKSGLLVDILAQTEKTYLGKFYAFLKVTLEETYQELSQYVPIPYSENLDTVQEKIDRLKEWRSGKTKPSTKTLLEYFENMGQFMLSAYAVLMKAIDIQVRGQDGDFHKAAYTSANYARYFDHFKEKMSSPSY